MSPRGESFPGRNLKRLLVGIGAGMALDAAQPDIAEAKPLGPMVEQQYEGNDPHLPFEQLTKSSKMEDQLYLLHHFDAWKQRPEAQTYLRQLAEDRSIFFLEKLGNKLLSPDLPWGEDVVQHALVSIDSNDSQEMGLGEHLFSKFDVSNPIAQRLLEQSMDHVYNLILDAGWWDKETPVQTKLFTEALRVAPNHVSYFYFNKITAGFYDKEFAHLIPDAHERAELVEHTYRNAITSGDANQVRIVYDDYNDHEPKHSWARKAVHAYGTDQFILRCQERIPGTVLRGLNNGTERNNAFAHYYHQPDRYLELARHSAKVDPISLVETNVDERIVQLDAAQQSTLQELVEQTYVQLFMHWEEFVQNDHDADRMEYMFETRYYEQHPEFRQGLNYMAEHYPVQLIDILRRYVKPEDQATYLPIEQTALSWVIPYRQWCLFDGLPNEAQLKQQWLSGASTDHPEFVLEQLMTGDVRTTRNDELVNTALFYVLEQDSYEVDRLIAADRLSNQDALSILSALAKDDFKHAQQVAAQYLVRHTDMAKAVNTVLEQKLPTDPSFEQLPATQLGQNYDPKRLLEALPGLNAAHYQSTTVDASFFHHEGRNLVTIPMVAFEYILQTDTFTQYVRQHGADWNYMNVISFTQAIYRRIVELHQPFTPDRILSAAEEVDAQWNDVKQTEIFGANTKFIQFSHAEGRFNNKTRREILFLQHGGSPEQILFEGKGSQDKNKLLEAIEKSGYESVPVTILFNGHGGKTDLYLDQNTALSFREVGDAIAEGYQSQKDLSQLRIVIDACYSYDFAKNLMTYLSVEKGVNPEGLIIITESNQDAVSFGGGITMDSLYLEAVANHGVAGQSFRLEDFRAAEADVWKFEDPAILVGLSATDRWISTIEVADNDD